MINTLISQNLILSLVNPEVYLTFTRDINNFINDGNTNTYNLTFDFPKA